MYLLKSAEAKEALFCMWNLAAGFYEDGDQAVVSAGRKRCPVFKGKYMI